jgi:putative spermidine/putrescine transport system ATP-binding protein
VSAPAIRLARVSRRFGDLRAVDDVSLDIRDGEFFSMLGPSGSGKTTCLRLIAGFEEPNTGTIELHGAPAAGLPPWDRDVNTVFQDYALFPHMTVEENIAYGLRIRRVARDERARRVAEMLDLVRLPEVGGRRPAELSGGERQRVALARALVNHPRVLLLDEPLGALDLKLREQMQIELKAIQQKVGITFVYVTHDQEEALAMSERLAVFREGRVEQVGTPVEVYERPATAFVADFVGVSNQVEGPLALRLSGSSRPFSIRPEKIRILETRAEPPEGQCSVEGRIQDAVYLGSHTRYLVLVEGAEPFTVIELNRDATPAVLAGRPVRLAWREDDNRALGDA